MHWWDTCCQYTHIYLVPNYWVVSKMRQCFLRLPQRPLGTRHQSPSHHHRSTIYQHDKPTAWTTKSTSGLREYYTTLWIAAIISYMKTTPSLRRLISTNACNITTSDKPKFLVTEQRILDKPLAKALGMTAISTKYLQRHTIPNNPQLPTTSVESGRKKGTSLCSAPSPMY